MVLERVCVVCNNKISSMRRSGVCHPCASARRAKLNRETREKAREAKAKAREAIGKVIVHACISNTEVDPISTICGCKKTVSKADAYLLVKHGFAVAATTRKFAYDGGAVVFTSPAYRTPRSATIEKAHIERGTEFGKTVAYLITELKDVEEENNLTPAERERIRWEEYKRLGEAWMKSITKEYSDEEFQRVQREQFGRQWSAGISEKQQRDRGAIGNDVVKPRLLAPALEEAITPELQKLIDEQRADDVCKIRD